MRTQHFHDFDAFAASIRDIESKMLLRNPTSRGWLTCLVQLGPIDIQLGRLGSGNIAQGQLRSDGHMIYLPLTDGVEYTANGTVIEKGSCAILEPGCEFCISTRVDHDWCAVFVPSSLVQDPHDLVMPSRTVRVTAPGHEVADKFRSTALQILMAASKWDQYEASPAARPAAEEMLKASTSILGLQQAAGPAGEGRPRISRDEVIQSCMVLIEQRRNQRVSVDELTSATNVSERTLRTAFNEYFGLGPVRYLRLRQLHRIRRSLKDADPREANVARILAEHGEWAFSRFASRYRKHFGELPSATLRRNGKGK